MSNTAYQKLNRIEIATALDTTTSRFCVMYNELSVFANAVLLWNPEASKARDQVLQLGGKHPDYHRAGEDLKLQLSLFTADAVMLDSSHLQKTDTSEVDVRACLLACTKIWEMSDLIESAMKNYDMVLRNMRSKSYKGIDKLESMYHDFCKEFAILIEERFRHLQFAVKAISLYAPAYFSLYFSTKRTLACISTLKPKLIEFTQTHNQFVQASHPAVANISGY